MWRSARIFGVLIMTLVAAAPAFAAGSPIGQVKKAAGTVSISRGSENVPVKPGTLVYQGDVIVTGPDGKVGITLIDNSVFSTGPSTQLSLPEYNFNAGNARGSMLADLTKGTLTVVTGQMTHTRAR